jgi:hypothetical protein
MANMERYTPNQCLWIRNAIDGRLWYT